MANLLSWGSELVQKAGVKASGKAKMAWKTLGGKATKETAEKIGKETGEKLASIDAKQSARRETAKAYKNAVKEARHPTERAAAAIETPTTSYDYRQRIDNGKEVFERRPTGSSDSSWASVDTREYRDARRNSHSNTAEFTYESPGSSSNNLPSVIAQENAESGAGFWDGIPGWAKMGGAAVAGGIASSIIFDDDE